MTRADRVRFAASAILYAAASVGWPTLAALANRHWYAGLLKPFFAPPSWLAAPLLVCVALAAAGALFRVLCRPDYHPDRPLALRAMVAALLAAAAWCWAFFVGRHPTLSLALAAVLVAASVWSLRRAAPLDGWAAVLLVPWTLAAVLVALVDLSVRMRNG